MFIYHNALKFGNFLCQIVVIFFSFIDFVKSLFSFMSFLSLSSQPADDIFREIATFTSRNSSFNDFFLFVIFRSLANSMPCHQVPCSPLLSLQHADRAWWPSKVELITCFHEFWNHESTKFFHEFLRGRSFWMWSKWQL